ncbi:MAG: CaiB/BaiF CoA transferase family protein [Thermomicrobiales bacterium]
MATTPPLSGADSKTGNEAGGRPLDGIRVVSLEQALAGPLCSRHLADLGAEVIKIERPGGGDLARRYDTSVKGLSSYFVWLNRNKRSLTLDLKRPAAVAVLEQLIGGADVFVQNLAPGAIDRLGLGLSTLRERYPALVICSISGYGRGGPYEHRKAFDLLLQGETGVMATTGTAELMVKAGISVGDIGAGVYGALATVAALYERQTTGQGRLVETSLFDALAEWMGYPVAFTQYGGEPPARACDRHATVVPYGLYRCGDGLSINLAVQSEEHWHRFCAVVCEHPEWEDDPRFASASGRRTHRDVLETAIESAFAAHPRVEITRRLDATGIPYGDVRSVAGFIEHPQLRARGRWQAVDTPAGPIEAIVPGFDLEDMEPRMEAVPDIGEQTDAILAELGYDEKAIEQLRKDGIA